MHRLIKIPDGIHVIFHTDSLIAFVIYVTAHSVGAFSYLGRNLCARVPIIMLISKVGRIGVASKHRSAD